MQRMRRKKQSKVVAKCTTDTATLVAEFLARGGKINRISNTPEFKEGVDWENELLGFNRHSLKEGK